MFSVVWFFKLDLQHRQFAHKWRETGPANIAVGSER